MKAPFLLSASLFTLLAAAQPGTLDPTFGINGRATAGVSGTYCSVEALAEQADGKIVVAGSTPGFALLVRFNASGSLDSGFGTNGLVLTDVDQSNDFFSTVAIRPDGKIVAGGVRFNNASDGSAIVARYNADGSLDSGFGTNGIVTLSIPLPGTLDSFVRRIVLQPNGHIVVLVERYTSTGWTACLVRLNGNSGAQEGFFGVVPLEVLPGADHYPLDVTLQADGKIIACGYAESPTGGGAFAIRVDTDGLIDETFGSAQGVLLDLGAQDQDQAHSVHLQPDGKVLLSGLIEDAIGYGVLVARLLPNGTLDATFGNGGFVKLTLAVDDWAVPTLDLQPDGRIVVGVENSEATNPRVRVFRLLPDGALDSSFGTNGVGISNATSGNNGEWATRTLLLSDGGIAVCGYVETPNNQQAAVWKFQSGLNLSVGDGPAAEAFRVAPNPVTDELMVEGMGLSHAQSVLTVRDMTGREVLVDADRQVDRIIVDASRLPAGAYTVTITTSAGQRSARFIRQ